MALPNLNPVCIDLLIATVGRKKELDRLLASLAMQTYRHFRILLADQNPLGYLDDILARHSCLPIKRVLLPSQGVSLARNILLEHAEGDIIAFPDDDCWYAPDTLERVLKNFLLYPSCGALLGVWTDSPGAPPPRICEGKVRSRVGLFYFAGTCVQFYRKDAIENIRFDPQLGPGTGLPYGCGEDTDFLLYVYARTEVRRYKEIQVFHPAPQKNIPPRKKIDSYAAGRTYLLKKHKFSLLFILSTVLYPLVLIPIDILRYGKKYGEYRWHMFIARCKSLFWTV